MGTIYSEVTAAYVTDRVIGSMTVAEDSLPWNLDEITLSYNEFSLPGVYNQVIDRLYENHLWLISQAEIPMNQYPLSAQKWVKFQNNYSSPSLENFSANPLNTDSTVTRKISSVSEIVSIPNVDSNKVFHLAFASGGTLGFEVDTDYSTVATLVSGNNVEFNRPGYEFSNVSSSVQADEFLFLIDEALNIVFKFDVSGYIREDSAIKRQSATDPDHPGRYLIKTIGGNQKGFNKLSSPRAIAAKDGILFVYDRGSTSIKVYDYDFNFLAQHADSNFMGDIVSIEATETSTLDSSVRIFALSRTGSIVTLDWGGTSFDPDSIASFSPFDSYDTRLNSVSSFDEQNTFKKIRASKKDLNVLYVGTNRSIVKFYKTNLDFPLAFFNWDDVQLTLDDSDSSEEIMSFDVTRKTAADDIIICTRKKKAANTGRTRFILLNDQNLTTKLYHDTLSADYYSVDDIKLDSPSQEFANAITTNKVNTKLFYNHLSLFEHLGRKVYGYYTDDRRPSLSALTSNAFVQPTAFNVDNSFNIGINEPFLADVYNRPIKTLYNQQVALFEAIKEEYLNSDPPLNVAEVLDSRFKNEKFQAIGFAAESPDITEQAGRFVQLKLVRTVSNNSATAGSVTARVYTVPDTATGTLTSDFTYFAEGDNEMFAVFDQGVSALSATFELSPYFGPDTKKFTVFVGAPSASGNLPGVSIDLNSYSRVITVSGIPSVYTIALCAANPTTITEGNVSTFAAIRTDSSGANTFYEEVSANVYTVNFTTTDADLRVLPYYTSYQEISGQRSDIPVIAQRSTAKAHYVDQTGTIIFPRNVSAVVFDLSAVKDTNDEIGEVFSVNIFNPSLGASLSSENYQQSVTINKSLCAISLSILSSADEYLTGTNYLTNYNVYKYLSADATFRSISTVEPIHLNLTIAAPLTVYSTSTNRGAIYFDYENESKVGEVRGASKVTLNIHPSAAVIGHGGTGGHGVLWASGDNIDPDATNDALSALDATINGRPGGPAISLSAFGLFSCANSGKVLGGAGGGGAGFLAITANPMQEISGLSASCAGGAGAGAYIDGGGRGGFAAWNSDSLSQNSSDEILAGNGGLVNNGGQVNKGVVPPAGRPGSAGGAINGSATTPSGVPYGGYNLNAIDGVSGLSGGDLGQSGYGLGYSTGANAWATANPDLSSVIVRGEGGPVGMIIDGPFWATKTIDLTTATGNYSGSDV